MKEIILRLKDNDRDALIELIEKFSPYVWKILIAYLGTGLDNEDLAQFEAVQKNSSHNLCF